MNPKVTAIINTYNRADKLVRAIESVKAQDFTDYELLVIHDGPPDDETIRVAKDAEVDLMALDENSGYQAVPKTTAVWHAQGDYISYLDDDNEWTPDHLSVLVEAIEGPTRPDMVYGRREYVDEREVKDPVLCVGPSPFVPFDEAAQQRLSAGPTHNFIDTSDMLISKGSMWRLQVATERMWNTDYRRFGDWELVARAVFFAGWRLLAVDHIVQRYYWHGENLQLTRPAVETPKAVTL